MEAGWTLARNTLIDGLTVAKAVRYALDASCRKRALRIGERQAYVGDKAVARSYWVVSFLLVLGVGWMSSASQSAWIWRPASYGEWHYLFWFAILLTGSLPQAIIAWKETGGQEDEPNGLVA